MFEKLTLRYNRKRINKDPNVHIVLLDVRITKIHGDNHTLIKPYICKVLPNFGNQNGLRSKNCTDLLQNRYHDGSLGVFSLFENFHGLQNPSSPRHSVLHGMG